MTPAELLDQLAGGDPPMVIDVRSAREYASGHLPQAVNIPVDEIRSRIEEVPADHPTAAYCEVGYRSYVAQQILRHHGRTNVITVLGGLVLIEQVRAARNVE